MTEKPISAGNAGGNQWTFCTVLAERASPEVLQVLEQTVGKIHGQIDLTTFMRELDRAASNVTSGTGYTSGSAYST